jgi:hypothetical protein
VHLVDVVPSYQQLLVQAAGIAVPVVGLVAVLSSVVSVVATVRVRQTDKCHFDVVEKVLAVIVA